MAKEGLKNEAARQELVEELRELTTANIKKDGIPKKDAVPQELVRIKEIEAQLRGGVIPRPTAPSESESKPSSHIGSETTPERVKRLEEENKTLKAEKARGRDAAKIKSVDKKVGYVPRPDEIMDKALADAEDRDPKNWDDSNKLAVERTIRRFVRKGGSRKDHKGNFYDIPAGFKKGITYAEKVYALRLLKMLGRLKGSAEDIIQLLKDREELPVSEQRQTNKEFNKRLEGLGVSWDDSIQVPGMSMSLRS